MHVEQKPNKKYTIKTTIKKQNIKNIKIGT